MNYQSHTQMQTLVQRASGAARQEYYPNDGANDPPPSPTAKWKGEVHAYENPVKDPSRYPYLPHPFPLKRKGRAETGHPGGFQSLQEPLQPPKFPDEDQVYMTYAEWWHAQRPGPNLGDDKNKTFSTSFWPYGRRVSCVTSMDKEDQYYTLDERIIKNHIHYKEKRDPSSMSRSRSSAELLGSQAEHFGYDRNFGRTMSSHAGATFHSQRKLTESGDMQASKKPNPYLLDSMQAQASARSLTGSAGQRATSAPGSQCSARSVEAQAASSRFAMKPGLTKYNGLGTRTHSEWALPQPPAYAVH